MEMIKNAAAKSTEDEKLRSAQRSFFFALFDLTWRLLAAMLFPLLLGKYIDSIRDNGQGFTNAGFLIGAASAAFVLYLTIRKLSK